MSEKDPRDLTYMTAEILSAASVISNKCGHALVSLNHDEYALVTAYSRDILRLADQITKLANTLSKHSVEIAVKQSQAALEQRTA